jgi:hypothetical protein
MRAVVLSVEAVQGEGEVCTRRRGERSKITKSLLKCVRNRRRSASQKGARCSVWARSARRRIAALFASLLGERLPNAKYAVEPEASRLALWCFFRGATTPTCSRVSRVRMLAVLATKKVDYDGGSD